MARNTRQTKQKEIIQKEIEKINNFFSSDELHKKVEAVDKTIGIATIYRYLKEETQKGNLFSYQCNRRSVYSKGKKSHCHYECEKTGKVIHFDLDNIDFLKNKIPGSITSFSLEVKGVCEKCS